MSNNESSGMTAIVAIVAIVIIVALGYVLFQKYMSDTAESGTTIEVDLPIGETQGE